MTSQPRVGDMIEFDRILYFHFGVYMGNGYVIHLTGDKWSCSTSSSCGKPEVKKELLEDVAGRSHYKVNNNRDHELKADSQQTISDRAHKYVGYSEYDLKEFNCETFASMCRYGRGRSKQADKYYGNVKSVKEKDLSVKRRRQQRRLTQHEVPKDTICEDGEEENYKDEFYDDKDDECFTY